jgi:peptidoglycan biosynthesis protein MviN/MurJ (putative lipid II flippase)
VFHKYIVFLGAIVNFALISFLLSRVGILGMAISYLSSIVVQVFFFWSIMPRLSLSKLEDYWQIPHVRFFFISMAPIVFVNIFSRIISLVGPHYASGLQEGSLAHLNYALRLFAGCTLVTASGIPSIAFPKMALSYSKGSTKDFKEAFFHSLESIWLLTAPVITFGIIFYAGFLWMTARGNDEQVDKAKRIIKNAIIGTVVVLLSYALSQGILYLLGARHHRAAGVALGVAEAPQRAAGQLDGRPAQAVAP